MLVQHASSPVFIVIVYYASCFVDVGHLRRFAALRQNLTEETQRFWDEVGQFIVDDRYHFRNHKVTHKYFQDH